MTDPSASLSAYLIVQGMLAGVSVAVVVLKYVQCASPLSCFGICGVFLGLDRYMAGIMALGKSAIGALVGKISNVLNFFEKSAKGVLEFKASLITAKRIKKMS